MRCFYYRILHPTGRVGSGMVKLAFDNSESARVYMEKRLQAVVVAMIPLPGWATPLYDWLHGLARRPVGRGDLAAFFRNLAVMQRSGIPIVSAVEEECGPESPPGVRVLAADILEGLRSGIGLGESMDRQADRIPETVRHLVHIGEASGTLDRTLMDAAEHLQRVDRILADTRKAMIYPAFVFACMLGTAVFWISYVVPNISALFRQMGVKLPAVTRAVLAASSGIGAHLAAALTVTVALAVAGWAAFRRFPGVRLRVHAAALRLPVSGPLLSMSAMSFITEYLSLLTGAGLTVDRSLAVLEEAVGNEVYRRAVAAVRAGVLRGESLSHGMRACGRFPGFVIRMVRTGEETGRLEEQLRYLAGEYRLRLDRLVASMGEVVKPLALILAGLFFAFMVVALFLPIYRLVGQIGAVR